MAKDWTHHHRHHHIFFHSKADESCSCLHAMNRRPSKHYTPGWPPPQQQQQQQQPKKKKNMSGTRGIMTYQHEQIYIAWEFVGNMWETNGKSHTAWLLGYPNKACHGASTTPNKGLPNAPGEPGLVTDPPSLGPVHMREMELHPNNLHLFGFLPQSLRNHVLNAEKRRTLRTLTLCFGSAFRVLHLLSTWPGSTGCSATARSKKSNDALVASASHQVVSHTKTSGVE